MQLLTCLTDVKAYLGILNTNQDTVLQQQINSSSDHILRWLGRPNLIHSEFTDKKYNGNGGCRFVLPEYPILDVSALSINNVSISESPNGQQSGFQFDDTTLYLFGHQFTSGFLNVLVSYETGYQSSEVFAITANGTSCVPNTDGRAGEDDGVVFTANGSALTRVTSSPAAGQYTFNSTTFTYGFAAADAGASIRMTYFFIPTAVAQACIEMCGLKMKQRDNLGVQSKSLAGETIVYSDRDMSASTKAMLTPYKKVIPAW